MRAMEYSPANTIECTLPAGARTDVRVGELEDARDLARIDIARVLGQQRETVHRTLDGGRIDARRRARQVAHVESVAGENEREDHTVGWIQEDDKVEWEEKGMLKE
jgi:hypothetical protein